MFLFKERKWIDIDPKPFNQGCFAVSKFMIRLLRHDASIPREDDGAVKIWRLDWEVQGKVRWHFAMDSWRLGKLPCKRREERRKGFNIAWTLIRPINSCTSEQFRDIQEVILLIHYCKTMYCCRMTLPSTSTTSGTLIELHSIVKSGLIPGGTSLRRDRQSVLFHSREPDGCSDKIREKLNTIWTNPESHRTNMLGKLTTIQYIGAILSLLRERDCNSIKLDHMQLLFQAHCQRFV